VLWRYEEAVATLFDARIITEQGAIRLTPFSQADPFLPVYGVEKSDPDEIENGRTFEYFEGQEITLEPGEQVASAVAFPLDVEKLGLMAVKVWIRGRQRSRRNEPYEWASFLFIDPDEVAVVPRVPQKARDTRMETA
jgi:hypothetical protein